MERMPVDPGFTELRGLNKPWRSILHLGRRHQWNRGQTLAYEKELLFLSRGKVRLIQNNPEGHEKTLWYIGEDTIFGETPFFTHEKPMAVFVCVTDCVAFGFSRQFLESVWRERPDLLLDVTRSMSKKMRLLAYQATSMSLDKVPVRICKFLAQRIIPDSVPLVAEIGMTREAMASLLGMNRVTLYKSLCRLVEEGVLSPVVAGKVEIMNPETFFSLVNNNSA